MYSTHIVVDIHVWDSPESLFIIVRSSRLYSSRWCPGVNESVCLSVTVKGLTSSPSLPVLARLAYKYTIPLHVAHAPWHGPQASSSRCGGIFESCLVDQPSGQPYREELQGCRLSKDNPRTEVCTWLCHSESKRPSRPNICTHTHTHTHTYLYSPLRTYISL